MTYKAIKEFTYKGQGPGLLAFVAPHGATADYFLNAFPQIRKDSRLEACWSLFEIYLEIERDVGSVELAHALARTMSSRHDISSLVIEVNYPRAVIDGGRLLDNCLRHCLPNSLFAELREDFLKVHQQSLDFMSDLYQRLKAEKAGFLVDVHTMASFCPANAHGERSTFPVSFPRLEDYVDQFLNAKEHNYLRRLDIISEDEKGQRVADPLLTRCIREALEAQNYAIAENEPYTACSNFLSYRHMTSVPAISLDVPKHMVSRWQDDLSDYALNVLSLDPEKIHKLAACMGDGIARALEERLRAPGIAF